MPTRKPSTSIEPRLLTKVEAAAYVGATPRNYDRLRKAGKVPGFVPGTLRVDKRALDAAIDTLSALGALTAAPVSAPEPVSDDPLEAWKAKRDARRSQRP